MTSRLPSLPHLRRLTTPQAYAAASLAWCLFAFVCAALGLIQIAVGRSAGLPALGPARLHMAYTSAVLLGAAPLALAGIAVADGPEVRSARRGLILWVVGLAAGVTMILLGRAGPAPWMALPPVAVIVVTSGIVLWSRAAWHSLAATESTSAWGLLVIVATLSGPVYLLLGAALGPALGGASGDLAAAAGARGLIALWLVPLAAAAAVRLLPEAAGRSVYGRQLYIATVVLWVAIAPLSVALPAAPDLVPPWLPEIAAATNALLLLPALSLAAVLVGTWVGRRYRVRPWALVITSGAVLICAAAAADAMLWPASRSMIRFTAWDPWGGLFPPFAGAILVALGAAGYLLEDPPPAAESRAAENFHRGGAATPWRVWIALAAAVAAVATPWMLGAAEAAVGATAALDRAGAAIRLPWAVLAVAATAAWLLAAGRASSAASTASEHVTPSAGSGAEEEIPLGRAPGRVPPQATLPAQARLWMAGWVAAALTVGLMISVFLPVADPSAVAPTPRTAARVLEAGGLREMGRDVYTRDGCAACHTQRVLAADQSWLGPRTRRGDYPPGVPALGGQRRSGPDLAWVGQRYPTLELMAARLAVHGPPGSTGEVGALPYPWLFTPEPTDDGRALLDYLLGLKSGSAGL